MSFERDTIDEWGDSFATFCENIKSFFRRLRKERKKEDKVGDSKLDSPFIRASYRLGLEGWAHPRFERSILRMRKPSDNREIKGLVKRNEERKRKINSAIERIRRNK